MLRAGSLRARDPVYDHRILCRLRVGNPRHVRKWWRDRAIPGRVRRAEAIPGKVRRAKAMPGKVRRVKAIPGRVRRAKAIPDRVRRTKASLTRLIRRHRIPGRRLAAGMIQAARDKGTDNSARSAVYFGS